MKAACEHCGLSVEFKDGRCAPHNRPLGAPGRRCKGTARYSENIIRNIIFNTIGASEFEYKDDKPAFPPFFFKRLGSNKIIVDTDQGQSFIVSIEKGARI